MMTIMKIILILPRSNAKTLQDCIFQGHLSPTRKLLKEQYGDIAGTLQNYLCRLGLFEYE